MLRQLTALTITAAALAFASPAARAEGEIRTPSGDRLELLEHRVHVQIVDQVAVTKVTQVFRNGTGRSVEGTYGFPLPEGAQLTAFRATIGDQLREGKMYEAAQARAAYNAARAAGQEAALAETHSDNSYTVALARIDAGAQPRVELEYIQLITYDTGMVAYTYPLVPKRGTAAPAGTFSFQAEVSSLVPITICYSNSHRLAIERQPEVATASFSAKDWVADKDLHLAYHVKRNQTGIDVRLHRPAGQDGYALIAITPRADLLPEDVIAKDITFVVDVSGSMKGEKIEQARRALAYCLRTLHARDRFNVVTFSYGADRLWDTPHHATKGNVDAGLAVADRLVANGGTNIGAALGAALLDGSATNAARASTATRPHIIVFLTDGRPTQGETRSDAIVDACTAGLRPNTRIFTFGIGRDLDHFLLRQVAARSRGAAAFVTQEHELELAISTFQQRIASPVLTDLELTATGAKLAQVYPRNVSFLFHGDQLLVCARYTGSGPGTIELAATAAGERRTFRIDVDFPQAEAGGAVLSRLWALKKMQVLLDELQLRGDEPELRKEVIALSLEHTVASPYTSFLVLDPNAPTATETGDGGDDEDAKSEEKRAERLRKVMDKAPAQDAQGGKKDQGNAGGGWASGGAAAPGNGVPQPDPSANAPVTKAKGYRGGAPSTTPTTPTGPSAPSGSPAGPSTTGGATAPTGPTGPSAGGLTGPAGPTSGPTGPTAPTAPSSPAAPTKPAPTAGRSASPQPQDRPAPRRSDRDARPNEPAAEEMEDQLQRAARGAESATPWLATQLTRAECTPRERAWIVLALEAGGQCRAFGDQAEAIAQACDALSAATLANETFDTWVLAALVRVESYRLSGLRAEKGAATALVEGAGGRIPAAFDPTAGVWAALLVRQAGLASIEVPAALRAFASDATAPADATGDAQAAWLAFAALNGRADAATKSTLAALLGTRSPQTSGAAHVTLAVAAGLTKMIDANREAAWAGQKDDGSVPAATGAVVETAQRLLADSAAYWLSQGQR